jgi:hypothetical protein
MFMNRVRLRLWAATFGIWSGVVTSANGAEVAYHFDRNAFVATARAGDGTYVALTDSGNLLAFDSATFALLAERIPRSPVRCLSATVGDVIAGLDDGRIVSVDAPSLQMKRIGAVDGRPAWIGRRRSGALLVAHGFAPEKPIGWGERGLASLVVEEMGTGRSLRIPFVATTFLLDSRDRLWVGADKGEWGGRLAVVDLGTWAVRELDDPPAGVYGLLETVGGRIWAYGGTMHMWMHQAFVVSVHDTASKTLYDSGFVRKTRPGRPTYPITHLVAMRGGRSFLALSYDQTFEVDAKLSRWKRLPDLKAHYHWGRPDAVGSYPAVQSIYVLGESPLRLLVATALDGWMELREGRFVSHRVAGQLGATRIRGVEDRAGKLVAHGENGSFVLESDGWHLDEELPSPVALPEVIRSKEKPQHAVHRGPNGKVVAVFRDQPVGWSDEQPHLLVTAECEAGRCRSMGQQTTMLAPGDTFLTPDAALWAIDGRGLWSFRDGRWSVVLEGWGPKTGLGFGVRVIPTKTPPWFLDGRDGAKLFWPGDRQTAPRLADVTGMGIEGPDPEEHDVVACGGHIYAVNADKICVLDDKGRCAPTAIKGARWPRRLGCDRRDRLWIGGYGVSRVEGGVAVPVHDLDGLIGGRTVLALSRDHGAGLAVLIENRGIAVLDPAQPAPSIPTRPPDEGDRARGDGALQAVLLSIDLGQSWSLLEELDAILRNARAGGYAGVREVGFQRPHFFEFYGRDARRVVDLIRARIEKEGRTALLVRRDGEAGAPQTEIEIRPPAGRNPDGGSRSAPSGERSR